MASKSTSAYEAVFNYIENQIFSMKPAMFMTDFEGGMRKAINNCYPGAELHGCLYHYKAAVRRKFLSINMYGLITEDTNARKIYRMLTNLPLLPSQSIELGYEIIKEKAHSDQLAGEFRKIFKYFEEFWLQVVCIFYLYSYEQSFAE